MPRISVIMKIAPRSPFLAALVALPCLLFAAEEGFTPLFNGKDLSGWKNPYEWGKAEIVGEEIHLTGDKKFFLVTEKEYSDYLY